MGDVYDATFTAAYVRRFGVAGVVLCSVSLAVPDYVRPGWGPHAFVGVLALTFAGTSLLAARYGVSAATLLVLALFVDGCAAAVPQVLRDGSLGMVALTGLSLPSVVVALYGSVRMLVVQTSAAAASALLVAVQIASQWGAVLVVVVAATITLTGPALVVAALRRRLDDMLDRERAQARTDPLTSAANRRGMEESMGPIVQRSLLAGLPIGVLVIDVDHFKQVNDRFGHEVGDHVLQAVGVALRECTRADDVLARLGGEEFVILAVMDPDGLTDLAERVRARVARSTIVTGVTVSVGVTWADPTTTPSDPAPDQLRRLIARGDELMYAAKQAGRNRVHCGAA